MVTIRLLMTSTNQIELEQFRAGNEMIMKKIYLDSKVKFIGFFNKEYKLQMLSVEDLYQDSFCVLHKNILSNRIKTLSSSWSTLLIGIGKNLVRNEIKKKKEVITNELPEKVDLKTPLDKVLALEKKKQSISILNLLGEACRKVLVQFYYHERSIQEISEIMGYANANVTKKKKSLCLKKLREEVAKNGIDR